MSRIQINDLNSSDFSFLSELTDEEMLDINGGGWFSRAIGIACLFFGAFFPPSTAIGVALIGAGAAILSSENNDTSYNYDVSSSWSSWSWLDEQSASGGAGGY